MDPTNLKFTSRPRQAMEESDIRTQLTQEEDFDRMNMSKKGRAYVKTMQSRDGIYVVPVDDQTKVSHSDIEAVQDALRRNDAKFLRNVALVALHILTAIPIRRALIEQMISKLAGLRINSRTSSEREARSYFSWKLHENNETQMEYQRVWAMFYNMTNEYLPATRNARRSTRNVNTQIQESVDLSYYAEVCNEIV